MIRICQGVPYRDHTKAHKNYEVLLILLHPFNLDEDYTCTYFLMCIQQTSCSLVSPVLSFVILQVLLENFLGARIRWPPTPKDIPKPSHDRVFHEVSRSVHVVRDVRTLAHRCVI